MDGTLEFIETNGAFAGKTRVTRVCSPDPRCRHQLAAEHCPNDLLNLDSHEGFAGRPDKNGVMTVGADMHNPAQGRSDRAARFAEVFATHADAVFAYARRRTTNEEAEEVVSETFLTAWRRMDDVPAHALPWLIGVARRVLANRRRGDDRRHALDTRLRIAPAPVPDPADSVATRDEVTAALARLPLGEREFVTLMAWEGLSAADVAAALGVSRAAVYLRLHRARRRFEGLIAASTKEDQ